MGARAVHTARRSVRTFGRYALHDEIASGGMGTVHLGRLVGEAGFARPVAIKRMHPHLARQEAFVRMFVDEARLAARVRHPNVLQTLDVATIQDAESSTGLTGESGGEELFVVMEYVHGAPLSYLLQQVTAAGRTVPLRIASSIANGMMLGLHAAHEATDEQGHALGIVHRDVSPQNVLVGADGTTRVLDFGVAKARNRLQASTGSGMLKGKLGYLAPEQIRGGEVTRQSDVYAAAVVVWELLTGRRLFPGDNEGQVLEQILVGWVDPPSKWDPSIPEELDQTLLRALDGQPERRFKNARELAMAIERCVPAAPAMEVGEWVERMAFELLEARAKVLARMEDTGKVESPRSVPGAVLLGEVARAEDASTTSTKRPRGKIALVALLVFVPLMALAFAMRTRTVSVAANEQPVPAPSVSAFATTAPSATIEELTPIGSSPVAAPKKPHTVKPHAKPTTAPSSVPVVPAPTTAGAAADCTPPWTWDALGRRIYKRHCLHLAPP